MDSDKVIGSQGEIDLFEVFSEVWRNRKHIVVGTAVFTLIGVLYALFSQPIFRAETIIAPKESQKGGGSATLLSQFGGFGGMMATQLGIGNNSLDRLEISLKGRELAGKVIQANNLMPILYANRWDRKSNGWKTGDSSKIPTIRNGIEKVRTQWLGVGVNKKNNTLTFSVEVGNPVLAEKIVSSYLVMLNEKIRDDIIRDAQANREYLEKNLSQTMDPAVRDKIQNIIAGELERMMLVNSQSFDILEKPVVPTLPVKPKKRRTVVLLFLVGLFFSIGIVVVKGYLDNTLKNKNLSYRMLLRV